MRVGIYARVSTDDKDQNVETQLIPLREFCSAMGWTIVGEWTDEASAVDFKRRRAWADLLDAASKRKIDAILVWRINRAFRTTLSGAQTLEKLHRWGVGFKSYEERNIDTTTPEGLAMFEMMLTFAQLDRNQLRANVRAGMARAKLEGKSVGRPKAQVDPKKWTRVVTMLNAGEISQVRAARMLKISRETFRKMLASDAEKSPV